MSCRPTTTASTRVARPRLMFCPVRRMVAEGGRGHAQVALLHAPHDGVGDGGGEEREAEPQHAQRGDDVPVGRGLARGRRRPTARARRRPCRRRRRNGPAPGRPAGRRPARRRSARRCRSRGRSPAVWASRPLVVLQVEAHEEGHGEGGRVVDEGGDVGEGEHPVAPKQVDVQHRIGRPRLPPEEAREPGQRRPR